MAEATKFDPTTADRTATRLDMPALAPGAMAA